ncbi:unnamed protein product, partial [marine sediment metagenome]
VVPRSIFRYLPTRPPITGRPKLSDDIQQTIALLSGWDGATRRLLKSSPAGILRVTDARAIGVYNVKASQDDISITCDDCPASEVMIRSFPDNVGKVFVNVNAEADENVGYPLFTGEWIRIAVNNLSSVQVWFEKDDDRVAAIYTE